MTGTLNLQASPPRLRSVSLEEAVIAGQAKLSLPRLLWPAEDRKPRTPDEIRRLAGLRASGT